MVTVCPALPVMTSPMTVSPRPRPCRGRCWCVPTVSSLTVSTKVPSGAAMYRGRRLRLSQGGWARHVRDRRIRWLGNVGDKRICCAGVAPKGVGRENSAAAIFVGENGLIGAVAPLAIVYAAPTVT